jgi:predicted TIM-barrel fold metal-dependent hydrolase
MSDKQVQPTTLNEIDQATDTRDTLAHARAYAEKNGLNDTLIVDIDAHVTETAFWSEVTDRIPSPVYQQIAKSFEKRGGAPGLLNSQPGISYQGLAGRIPHQEAQYEEVEGDSVHRQVVLARRAMESMGIDYMMMFPTPMLSLGVHPQAEVEVELAWAFNRWVSERVLSQDDRLKGFLYLPFNTPDACPAIVEEFADDPGIIGASVTSIRYQPVHHNAYMKTYSMLEERGLPLSFHAGFNWSDGSMAQLNKFLSMHALSFVHCNLIHMTNWIINGLPERFPKLDVIWIESGLAWLPYLMQRLDSEYLKRSSEAPLLKRPPSAYIKEMYFSSQPLETDHLKLTEATFEAIDAENQLMWCSDWPHWDFDGPSAIYDLPFLTEKAKKKILGENAARVFNLPNPYLVRQAAE